MSRVLYIQASPRADRSYSIAVADAFLEAYGQSHEDAIITTLNLFEIGLPPLDGEALNAKYAILHGQKLSSQQTMAWDAIERVIRVFTAADKYVMAVPMWNFGIPYRLKQYIDVIVQPTYTFSYTPKEGYKPLVTGKPMFIAYARGGDYTEGSGQEAFDLQTPYLETILQFIGFTDIRSAIVEPTLMGGSQLAQARRQAAIDQAHAISKTF